MYQRHGRSFRCYLVQTGEYAIAQSIDHESAFNQQVRHTLKNHDRIVYLVQKRQTRYLQKTYKFGIELSKTVSKAHELDKNNGNSFWSDAIVNEMNNVNTSFYIMTYCYKQIHCRVIFDVKMEYFRRKARVVADGHMTKMHKCQTYSSVVSRETFRLSLTISALNDLQVKSGDIINSYVTASITKKFWTVLGNEWGADAGKKDIIVRALCVLKSTGAAFHKNLADCMSHAGYNPCPADPDMWNKPKVDIDGDIY